MSAATVAVVPGAQEAEEAERRPVALAKLAPVITAALVFAVAAWAFHPYAVGVFYDDGAYVVLAKAIATGHGYHYINLPGAPAATHYPPGFPLLLALVWRLAPSFPQNIGAFLLVQAALLSLAALGTFRFARRVLGFAWPTSMVIAVAATLSLPLLTLGSTLFSEVCFLAMLFPVLSAAERVAVGESSESYALAAGLAAGALALVRSHAVVVVAAAALILVWRRRWKTAALYVLAAVVVLLPWQLWVSWHDGALAPLLREKYGSYGAWFSTGLAATGMHGFFAVIGRNLYEIAATLADRVAPPQLGPSRLVVLALAIATFLFGMFRLWKRAPVTVAFLAGYLAITIVWPYWPWRFVFGVWPFFLLAGAWGGVEAIRLARTAASPWPLRASAANAALLVVCIGVIEVGAFRARQWETPVIGATQAISPLVQWVLHNTNPDDLIASDGEPLVYLFTGREALPPVPFTAAEYVRPQPTRDALGPVRDALRRYPVRYVLTVVPSTAAMLRSASAPGLAVDELSPFRGGAVFAVRRP